jgi:hypothetical protein
MIKVDNKEIIFGGQLGDIQEEISQLLNRLYTIARKNDVADQFDKAMIAAVLIAGVKIPSVKLAMEILMDYEKHQKAADELVAEVQKAMNEARKYYEKYEGEE